MIAADAPVCSRAALVADQYRCADADGFPGGKATTGSVPMITDLTGLAGMIVGGCIAKNEGLSPTITKIPHTVERPRRGQDPSSHRTPGTGSGHRGRSSGTASQSSSSASAGTLCLSWIVECDAKPLCTRAGLRRRPGVQRGCRQGSATGFTVRTWRRLWDGAGTSLHRNHSPAGMVYPRANPTRVRMTSRRVPTFRRALPQRSPGLPACRCSRGTRRGTGTGPESSR